MTAISPIFALLDTLFLSSRADVVNIEPDGIPTLQQGTVALAFTADSARGRQGLLSHDARNHSGDGNHMSITVENGTLVARLQWEGEVNSLNQGGIYDQELTFGGIDAGTEYHVAVTFDGSNAQLVVNGEVVDQGESGFIWTTGEQWTQVGAYGGSSRTGQSDFSDIFEGSISDVAIFDQVLSDADLVSLADAGAPAPDDTPVSDDGDGNSDDGGEAPVLDTPEGAIFAMAGPLEDVVNLGPPDGNLALSSGTVALSFTANTIDGRQGLISRDAKSFAGDGNHVSVYIKDGDLIARFQDEDGGKNTLKLEYEGLQVGVEYHIAITFSGTTAQLMVNGEIVDQGASAMDWETTEQWLQIGAFGGGSRNGRDDYTDILDGSISNVAIFDEVLSETAVASLWDGSVETPDTPLPDQPPAAEDEAPAQDEVQDPPAQEEPVAEEPDLVTDESSEGPDDAPVQDDPPVVIDDDDPVEDVADAPVETDDDEADTPPPPPASITDVEHGKIITLDGQVSVMTGRTWTLEHDGDNIASIKVLDKPDFGNLTVNPDNSLALVLSMTNQTGKLSFSYEVTYEDGTSETVNKTVGVTEGTQDLGWGLGEHYTLEEGDDGSYIVEHGEDHRVVHISNSNDALSRADIAALEGIPASQIDGEWLANHPEYGADPSMALKPDAGMTLWNEITGNGQVNSNWLLFESGYTYSEAHLGNILDRDTSGESELHPVYIGAYGEGDKPVLDARFDIVQGGSSNIVVQGVELAEGARVIGAAENLIFDDVTFKWEAVFQNSENVTVRDSAFLEIWRDDPVNSGSEWAPHANRIQGIYSSKSDGLLMEDLFFDHVGWEDGYDPDLSASDPMPPSIYSHSVYMHANMVDVTLRDSIMMRSASFGAQMRSGGFIEDNLFLDNNAALNFHGGDVYDAGHVGQYSLVLDNLITSAGYRDENGPAGALSAGIDNKGMDTALVDNIVAHLFDPNNPQEFNEKYWGHQALEHDHNPYYNDTIVYNWYSSRYENNWESKRPNQNDENLDQNVVEQTTIQLFTEELLGSGSKDEIDDFANYIRAIYEDEINADLTSEDVIAWFAEGFGIADPVRDSSATLRFVPDDRGDGMRWDNKLNWDTEDTPRDGDSVDLAGNWVHYSGTIDLNTLDFGDGGELYVHQGKLDAETVETGDGGGVLSVDEAGQAWIGDYADGDGLDVTVEGGRFAVTGKFNGLFDILVKDGQALLGVDDATTEIGDGSTLTVDGSDAKVGFDGDKGGVSVLEMQEGGTLSMVADAGGFATIEEFRSGAFDDDQPDVLSAFDMGEGTLLLDVTGLQGKTATETLIETDEMVGMFDEIQVIGLAGNQDATLVFDYDADTVTLSLSASGSGSGSVNIVKEGDMLDAQDNATIWDALTDGQGTYEELDTTPEVNGEELDEDDMLAA